MSRRVVMPLALGAGLALLVDVLLGAWPMGVAGWITLLALSCAAAGRWVAGSALLGLAAVLAPPVAAFVPLLALDAGRRAGVRPALVVAAVGLVATAMGSVAGRALGWAAGVPWTMPPPPPLTSGAHNLWWLLLEHQVTLLDGSLRLLDAPLCVWTLVIWLPWYAVSALALWRATAPFAACAAFALWSYDLVVCGGTPADAGLTAMVALSLVGHGRWWLAVAAGVVMTGLVNLALAPLSVPAALAPRTLLAGRTLNAEARVVLGTVWAVALLKPVWAGLPERWRRVFRIEPGAPRDT